MRKQKQARRWKATVNQACHVHGILQTRRLSDSNIVTNGGNVKGC